MVETDLEDVRDQVADEAAQADEDAVRVPSADETADTVDRAQRALAEIAQRQAADQAREAAEAHAAQLARWQVELSGALDQYAQDLATAAQRYRESDEAARSDLGDGGGGRRPV